MSSNNSKITAFIKESKHLFIPFQVIQEATKNFITVIGKGGYGSVYKGELLLSGELTSVAVKRLDSITGQGSKEFLTEIQLLSRYKHPNIVSLLGFCDEAGEKILVYEYAERGSLDKYLRVAKTTHPLTWEQRIRICHDTARGLDYLHNHRVIHKDIKSGNILISHDWKAMITDFGFSLLSHGSDSYLIDSASGTLGYCDPAYMDIGILTKESDVYSFGVVMFEVLCGMFGVMNVNKEYRFLAQLAQRYYETGRLNEIIDPYLKTEVDSDSLKRFSEIAYLCLLNERDRRPSMGLVVQKLEEMMPSSKVDDYDDDGDVSRVSSVTVETLPPTQLEIYQTKYPEDMVTHNRVLATISAALEDKSKQFIGIYGLGGVGKTTLAKKVVARLKNTNMFDDVAFTTVSQKVDVGKIKKDLENAKMRMMKGDRILIILDDVWEKLNLEELGIQCGNNYMNCKILLTSRSKEVCRKMSAQSMIHLNLLPTEEAWILFKRVVGGRLETDANLKPVARKVVEECGGLPLLIQAIGNALKDENIQSWESALSQLKEPAASEMERDIEKAFTRLRLSYEYLKSEEAKSCFLLCSFFPEDDDISLEDLVWYLVGLEKFDSIKDARDRVQNAVNILISSGLLLNGKWEGYTKMHDVVRDVALLIASKDENKFLVEAGKGLKEWLPGHNMLESYTGISLMKNWISKLPDYEVHLSSLDIFLVNNNPLLRMISDEFIKGMKEVKVLDMGWCLISHLPQSLKLLTKLRMLNLEENYLFHEISILGEMKELEILILNRTGIKEIPKEIGQLVNLRRLEVSRCRYMTRVTPGVISKLQSLEELCIDLSRMIEGANGCTAEVMKLLKLTFLDLVVKSCEVIPEGFNLEKLNGFVIQIGEYHRDFYRGNELRMSDRYLIISSKHLVIPLLKWIEKFIEVSRPITILNGIQNLNNIMPELYHIGFNKLEHIQLNYCHNVLCLLEDCTRCDGDERKTEEKLFKELKHLKLWYLDNLEVLWKYECVSLTNLVSLFIEGCDKLERVFTVSVAQGLVNLKKLGIEGCSGLEEVIWGGVGGGGDDKNRNVIVFPSLATISLIVLERLKMFFNSTGNCSIDYPSLVYVKIHDCESMKIWGLGIHETPNLKRLEMEYVEPIVVDGNFAINEAVEKLWRKR